MKNPSTRTLVSAVLLVALPLFMACFSHNAEAQGLFEAGATTGAVGGGAAGAGSGIGGALNNAMSKTAAAVGSAAGSTGGGSSGGNFSSADAAFGVGSTPAPAPAAAPAATADFSGTDQAFESGNAAPAAGTGTPAEITDEADPDAPVVLTAEQQEAEIQKHMTAFMKTKLGSLPPSVISTLTYEQYEAWRRAKAEKYALSNGSYGTANYVPRRQMALEGVIQQAKDMQYSQEMIDEIARTFRLKEYIDYDYDVRYGKDPSGYLRQLERIKRERERRAREQREFNERMKRFIGEQGGVTRGTEGPIFTGGPGGTHQPPGGGPIGPITGGGEEGKTYEEMMQRLGIKSDIPPDVVASLEAAIHNAVLDKLKGKGFNVAALNVFLHNKSEVKIIVIVTTSELPQSRIRGTLRQVRGIIENEVLSIKFKPLRLAQLSSFTILNEVDNHFYEHPVLYWQMQLAGWDSHGRRLTPSTPGMGERLPQADPDGQGDEMLRQFLGN